MAGNTPMRQPGNPPPLNDRERSALSSIRAVYVDVSKELDLHSSRAQRLRSKLIERANPHAKLLTGSLFKNLLNEVSNRSGRTAGFAMSSDAIERACERQSFGPVGVIPEGHVQLASHISAMCRALDAILYPRR